MRFCPTRIYTAAVYAGLLVFLGAGCARVRKSVDATPPDPNETPTLPAAADIATEERIAALSHFAAGLSHEINAAPKEALEEFWQSLLLDPTNYELALDVSRRLLSEGQKERALVLLKSTAEKPTAPGAVFTWMALAHLQCGQTNEAIIANERALKKSPENFAAYQNLTQIYLQTGQTNQAIKVLDRAATAPNTSPEFVVILAETLLRMQRDDVMPDDISRQKILALLERAWGSKTDNPIVLQKIGDMYLAFGEVAKAVPPYEKLLVDFPTAPGIKEKLANVYLRTNNKEKAAEYFEKLRQERPTDPLNHYLLGSIAFEARDAGKAEEFFETAMKLNPEFEPIYYDLAGAKISLNKNEEAVSILEKARSKFKLNFVLEYYSGLAKSALHKYAEAVSHFTSAELIAKSGDANRLNAQFYFQLGASHERAGNIADSVKAFRKALELKPGFADALNYVGYMWAERGENLDEAHSMIKKAVELEPDNAAFLDSYAWVLHKLDRPKEALEQMLKAISHSEKADPTLLDHLGDIHAQLKDFEKAREAWSKSLALEPNEKIQLKLQESTGKAP
jgi:tetratricopeptide (TPR) repeat protein